MSRLAKFLTVGASGALFGLGIQIAIVELLHWHYALAYTISYIPTVISNYIFNSLWTFREKQSSYTGLGKYFLTSLTTFAPKLTIILLLTSEAKFLYWISTTIVIAAGALVNFILSRKLIWTSNAKKVS